MKPAILIRVLGLWFYRKNFAAFAMILYFTFGILTTREHLMLAEMISRSLLLLLIIIGIWSTYIISTVNFARLFLQQQQNRFLLSLSFLPKAKQVAPLLGLQAIFTLPVSGYGLFLIMKSANVKIAAILAGFLVVAHVIPVIYYIKFLQRPFYSFSRKVILRIKLKKPFIAWPVLYVWNENSVIFLLMKSLACGIIFLTSGWDSPQAYDERWWLLGIFFSSLPGIMLLKDVVRFLTNQRVLLGQFPWGLFKFFTSFSGIVILLLLPELLFILRYFNYERNIVELIMVIAFLFSIHISSLVFLVRYNPPEEKMLTMLFYFSIGLFVLILFNIPVYMLIITSLLSCLWIFRRDRIIYF